MAKTSHQIEKEFIQNLKDETGKTLEKWIQAINQNGSTKRNDIINSLKNDHGFGHMNASLLAGIYLNGGKPVYGDPDELLAGIFECKEQNKPLYDALLQAILNWNPDLNVEIKKSYVSIQNKREFAAIGATAKEVRVAMDLNGDLPFDDYLNKTTGIGCMPRMSHMVKLTSEDDINEKLFDYLNQAYLKISNS